MSGQTSYTTNAVRGVEGQAIERREINGFQNETATDMGFGLGVIRGTDPDKQCKLPSATGFSLLGFTVFDGNAVQAGDNILVGDSLSIMRDGTLYVKPEDAVVAGDQAYVRHSGRKQVQTIVLDADFVASNVINGTIGGVAISPVTYATSHAATLTALATEIQSFAGVETAVAATRTVTVTTLLDGADQTAASFVITLGASQAGVVETETVEAVNTDRIGNVRTDGDSSTADAVKWTFEESGAADSIVKLRRNAEL